MNWWAFEHLLIFLVALLFFRSCFVFYATGDNSLRRCIRGDINGFSTLYRACGDVLTPFLPILAIVVSVFAYGANGATSTTQLSQGEELNRYLEQVSDNTQKLSENSDSLNQIQKTTSTYQRQQANAQQLIVVQLDRIVDQFSDLRGELHFRAHIDGDDNLILSRLSGEAFFANNLVLFASFQPQQTGLPKLGDGVAYDPKDDYDTNHHIFRIEHAGKIACEGSRLDICNQRLVRILLEFEYEGERHRVVAKRTIQKM